MMLSLFNFGWVKGRNFEIGEINSGLRARAGVGAGFSLNGLTCGSISGAAMAIGLKYGRKNNEENPQSTWSRVDKFIEAFKERWGAVTCRELTRLDVKTPEGMKEYLKSVHDYACTERVKFAVKQAIELLE